MAKVSRKLKAVKHGSAHVTKGSTQVKANSKQYSGVKRSGSTGRSTANNQQSKVSETDLVSWFSTERPGQIKSDFDILYRAETGISKASVDLLASTMGVSKKFMAEEILQVSVKTIERKEDDEKLDNRISSHALEIARVMQRALQVFEDEERVKRWLSLDNRALGNRKPVFLLKTLSGINLVNDILGRIEEGVYS